MTNACEKPQCVETVNSIIKWQYTRTVPSVQLGHKTLVKFLGEEEDREEKR